MSTLTIRLPDDKYNRLKLLAKRQHVSLNKLMEEMSTIVLAEFDTEMRFRARSAKGSPKEGLKVLNELDNYFQHAKVKKE